MSGLVLEGDFVDTSLSDVLFELALRRATGILSVRRQRALKKICFVAGEIRYAASNIREEVLTERLLAEGLLDPTTYAILSESPAPGVPIGRLVLDATELEEAQVVRALDRQIREAVTACLGWTDGTYRFEEGMPDLGDEIRLAVPPEDLIVRAAREAAGDAAQVDAVLGSRDLPLSPFPGANHRVTQLRLSPMEGFLVALADGKRTARDLLDAVVGDQEEATRSLFVLMRARLVGTAEEVAAYREIREQAVPAAAAAAPVVQAPQATGEPPPRAAPIPGPAPDLEELPEATEIEALLREVAGDDLFAVLGLADDAERAAIRDAYFERARRFHPDRFREGALAGFHAGLEKAFARLTQAYTTLMDPAARAEYRRAASAPAAAAADPRQLAAENHRRGLELLAAGRRVDALRFLENAARLDAEAPLYRRDLALLQAQNPRLRAEAEATLRELIQRSPSDADARVGLGLLLRRKGQEGPAVRLFNEALSWDATHVAALAALGQGSEAEARKLPLLGGLFRSS